MVQMHMPVGLPPAHDGGPGAAGEPATSSGPAGALGWWRGRTPAYLREFALVAVLFCAYKLGRLVAAGDVADAFTNSWNVWSFERLLHLPNELALQHWVLQWPHVISAANTYYAVVHFPLTAAFLVWLWWRDRARYRWIRTILVLMTAGALLVHVLMPLAPPRMMTGLGFVDTGLVLGQSVYASPSAQSMANQFAAMPSLHVGWAFVVALGVVAASRSRWRWIAVLHPLVTTAVVVVTANHYWLDGIAALLLLGFAMLLAWPLRESAHRSAGNRDESRGGHRAEHHAGEAVVDRDDRPVRHDGSWWQRGRHLDR
jgi:hypothetical protein